MSHRAYLYNINTPSTAENADTMMMEWGYEMPLMLQPLLLDGGFISGNNYNNHVEFNDSGLYFNAKPGIENLKRFYNFLEAQPELIRNIEKFKTARDKLFNYLDQLDGSYFHLDMWDILNMEDKPHAEQAKDWLATIAHNNQVITMAMDSGDVSLLNYKALKDVSPAFTSFSDLLNYEDYDYGWTCIDSSEEEKLPYEIFEENELWGLKDKDGIVLLRPQFDEFYSFGPEDLAVVSKNGKYGYVDTTGRIAIPLTWDDAFDFEYSGFAVVVSKEKRRLINTKGDRVTPLIYDELNTLNEGNYFNAKIDGLWGTIDPSGAVVIAVEHENEPQAAYGFYHIEVAGQRKQKIFNAFFKYLGEFPLKAIENLHEGIILIKPHKGTNFNSIYKKDGTQLDSGFEFDLVVRKPTEDGFAYAFKEDRVYTVSEAGIRPTDKAVALEHTGDDYVYYFEYETRKRLLVYAKGQKMDDQQIHDELSDTYSLFDYAEQAFTAADYDKAIYYYTIAAEKGHTPSMNNLAHTYYSVNGFKDDDQAFFWFHKSAVKGNEGSMNGLGMCYKYGVGCQADMEKALYWLNKAAEAQLALANNNLGDIYSEEGLLLFNPEKALTYYQAAAALGEPKYNWLGYLYDLKAEYEKALECYQLSAEEGNEISAFNFGILTAKGLGTEKNNGIAIKYFELSLTLGYPNAHLELATIYRNEKGFINETKAQLHIKEAELAGLEIPEDLQIKKKGWLGL